MDVKTKAVVAVVSLMGAIFVGVAVFFIYFMVENHNKKVPSVPSILSKTDVRCVNLEIFEVDTEEKGSLLRKWLKIQDQDSGELLRRPLKPAERAMMATLEVGETYQVCISGQNLSGLYLLGLSME